MRGYPQELEDFVGAISERREPLSGGLLAREVVEVIYAGYRVGGTRMPRGAGRGHDSLHEGPRARQRLHRPRRAGSPGAALHAAIIERICDRNWGVGSDGILLLVPTPRADFGLRIFNPDGSEAEKSGNGLRIFAKYLWDHGRTKKATFTVDTKGGVVECQCHVRGRAHGLRDGRDGRATFRAPEIPMNGPDREVVGVPLQLGDGTTLPSPRLGGEPALRGLRRAPRRGAMPAARPPHRAPSRRFPTGPTCSSRASRDRDAIEILIWERGAGFTLASGSSSCGRPRRRCGTGCATTAG